VHHLWQGVRRRGGRAIYHRLLHYIDDRKVSGDRWVAAMESASVPLSFVWGPQDPVSGAHVLDCIRRRMPQARLRVLPDVGHYPQIEAPDRIGPIITGLIGGQHT
jgi:pimeloyl-ACP methyl ester carboxylesterase